MQHRFCHKFWGRDVTSLLSQGKGEVFKSIGKLFHGQLVCLFGEDLKIEQLNEWGFTLSVSPFEIIAFYFAINTSLALVLRIFVAQTGLLNVDRHALIKVHQSADSWGLLGFCNSCKLKIYDISML